MSKKEEIKVLLKYTRKFYPKQKPIDYKLLNIVREKDIDEINFRVHGGPYGTLSGGVTVYLKNDYIIEFLITGTTYVSFPTDGYEGSRAEITNTINFDNLKHLMRRNMQMTRKTKKFIKKFVRGKATKNQAEVYTFIGG